jgi:Alg9-like mannosyltransferase family
MKNLPDKIRSFWETNPLAFVMIVAVVFRTFAVIFAKGYGMHDDHFCVIDIAQRWVNGSHEWLGSGAHWRSLVYPGLHYLLFEALQKLGIFDPQAKMFVVRFLHGLFSLVTVFYGYKVMRLISDEKTARLTGLLLAILWPMPFMSVRNLQEFVCIPPMMMAFYYLYLDNSRKNFWHAFAAGALFGLAFAVRFQTLSIAGTVGIVLLVTRRFRPAFLYGAGYMLSAFCVQGISDWVGRGIPFKSFWDYVVYNSGAGDAYTTGPFYTYIGLIIGVLIPPMSLLLLFGFFRTWKEQALIFWPTLVFFVLHSAFPNKQERFILPVIPFITMLSVLGWREFAEQSKFWKEKRKLLNGLWVWFWVFNSLLLLLTTFTYSKKSRVETLSYLSRQSGVTGVVVETTDASAPMMPLFYLNRNVPLYAMPMNKLLDSLKMEIGSNPQPNRVIFLTAERLDLRVRRMEQITPGLVFDKKIVPSIADQLLYFLNPKHNVNQTSFVYRTSP